MEYLQSAGDMRTEAEIAEHDEGKTGPKRKALRALVEQGQVIRAGTGKKGDPFTYKCFSRSQGMEGTRERECPTPQQAYWRRTVEAVDRYLEGRSIADVEFFCINGYLPENPS
jgi:hypothetical protein